MTIDDQSLWQVIYDAAANEGCFLHDDTVSAIEAGVSKLFAAGGSPHAPHPPDEIIDRLLIWTRRADKCLATASTIARDVRCTCGLNAAVTELAAHQAIPAPPPAWQPIETAPEATWLLVFVPNYGLNIATMTRDPNILGENGKFWFIRGEQDPCRPTHWMPLPDPPVSTPDASKEPS